MFLNLLIFLFRDSSLLLFCDTHIVIHGNTADYDHARTKYQIQLPATLDNIINANTHQVLYYIVTEK